jgi:hypothetical protein
VIHNHCAIELAIDSALYELNVKRVFGATSGLHHLRHRSHEPKSNQPLWENHHGQRYKTVHEKQLSIHPSLSLEITPLDVESPNVSPVHRRAFIASAIGAHRSTPTTPLEESRYRNHLGDSLGVPPLLHFTESHPGFAEHSLNLTHDLHDDEYLSRSKSDGIFEMEPDLAAPVTPPSTPSFLSPSLGSQGLNYAGKMVNDASGTRRMMLRRKNSSLRRSSSSINGESLAKVQQI